MANLPEKEMLRVDEVATYFNVSRSTIYLWIDHGVLEAIKIQGTIRIPRQAVDDCKMSYKMAPLA